MERLARARLIATVRAKISIGLQVLIRTRGADTPRTRRLVDLVVRLKVTFHRASGMSFDLFNSVRDLQPAGGQHGQRNRHGLLALCLLAQTGEAPAY
jgi:copper homeostasis protein CutC